MSSKSAEAFSMGKNPEGRRMVGAVGFESRSTAIGICYRTLNLRPPPCPNLASKRHREPLPNSGARHHLVG